MSPEGFFLLAAYGGERWQRGLPLASAPEKMSGKEDHIRDWSENFCSICCWLYRLWSSWIERITFASESSRGLVVSMMHPPSSKSSKRGFHCSHSSQEVIWNSETFPLRPSKRRFCTCG